MSLVAHCCVVQPFELCHFGTKGDESDVAVAGYLPSLLTTLTSDKNQLHTPAAKVLCWLASGSEQNKSEVVAGGAVPALVSLLELGPQDMQKLAANAFNSLAYGNDQNKHAPVVSGALPALDAQLKSEQPLLLQEK